jgi:hypothetical protein
MATKTMNRNELLPSVTSAEKNEIKGGKKTLSTLEVDKCNNKGQQEKNISMTTTIRRRSARLLVGPRAGSMFLLVVRIDVISLPLEEKNRWERPGRTRGETSQPTPPKNLVGTGP